MLAEAPFLVQAVAFVLILALFSPLIYFVFWLGLESSRGSDLAGRRPGDPKYKGPRGR